MEIYYGRLGAKYILSEKVEIGEDYAVYTIANYKGFVAKIYRFERFRTLSEREQMEDKLISMIRRNVKYVIDGAVRFVWPQDIIYENGVMVGFVMPHLQEKTKIYELYQMEGSLDAVDVSYVWEYAVRCAYHLSWLISYLHSNGIVVGNFNLDAIRMNEKNGNIVISDCESFVLAETIAGEDMNVFAEESDDISLAVIMFRLFNHKVDPFYDEIKEEQRPKHFPIDLWNLFVKSFRFAQGTLSEDGTKCVSASQWCQALEPYACGEKDIICEEQEPWVEEATSCEENEISWEENPSSEEETLREEGCPEEAVIEEEEILSEETVIEEEEILSEEAVIEEEEVLSEEAVIEEEEALSEETVIEEEEILSEEAVEEAAIEEEEVLSEEAVIEEVQPEEEVQLEEDTAVPTNMEESTNSNGKKRMIISIVLLIILGIGIYMIAVQNEKQGLAKPTPVEKEEDKVASEEPEDEEIISEEPIVEEPIVEEPTAEEPIVEEPQNNEDQPVETIVSEYLIPDSNSRYLQETDLNVLSKEQVRLARNEIFARHGRKFQTEWIQTYFESKSWYEGKYYSKEFDHTLRNTVFNEYERANVSFIYEYEKQNGYR